MIKKILKKVGLSDKEIKIYLAGIKQGPVLANFLAKQANISRQNTYDILNKLIKKGLVSSTGKKYSTRFIMEEPANIQRLLDKKKREIEKIKKALELAMPEIESFYKTEMFVPKIKFYEGKESMRNLFFDSLNCESKEILAIVPTIEFYKTLGTDFVKHYVNKRVKKNTQEGTTFYLYQGNNVIYEEFIGAEAVLCSDGTLPGECSNFEFCTSNGDFINTQCDVCGCPSEQTCDKTGGTTWECSVLGTDESID